HVLNLAVSEGMKVVVNSIVKLQNFVSYIRKSQPLFEDLKKVFQANRRPFLVPDLDISTRWNSTYNMIEKMFRIRQMTENNPALRERYLSKTKWHEIEAIVLLLEPIARATLILSSSTRPTIEDLYMIFPTILNILHDALDSEIQINNQIAQRMYKKLNDYWTVLQTCCSVSVALDPNMKLSSFDSKTAIIV
ncbi:17412_t:CDS:2, partial [Gigaspora rosea]